MDNLTHGLVGYALYKLSPGIQPEQKEIERRVMWAAILASELPDADMVTAFLGQGINLLWHRTYTHSLPGLLILAIILTFIFNRIWPDLPRRRLLGLTFAAGLIHSFLDLLTTYGTKFLLPWSDTPYGWDILPIIDPFLLVPLAAFLWAGSKNKAKPALWSLVVLMVLYVGFRGFVHSDVVTRVQSGIPDTAQVKLMPVIGSINSWRFTALLIDGSYQNGSIRRGGSPDVDLTLANFASHPAVTAAANTETMHILRRFARMIAYKVEHKDGQWHVTVFDPRWAYPGTIMFAGHIWLDESFTVMSDEIATRR